MYNKLYKGLDGKTYSCRIINEEGVFCDIEFDPEIENLTMLHVRKSMVR